MSKQQYFLVKPTDSSFIRVDEAILAKLGDLRTFNLLQNKGRFAYLIRLLCLIPVLLVQPRGTIVIVWFADYHAAVAVILARLKSLKSLVFIGGYDAVCYPELQMGVYCRSIRAKAASLALSRCSLIVANHESLIKGTNYYYDEKGHLDGVQHLINGLRTPSRVVYNALSRNHEPLLEKPRDKSILCVGTTPRFMDFYNKGFDLLIEAARKRPDYSFTFVGINAQWVVELESLYRLSEIQNLELIEYLPQKKLFSLMESSRVYAQISISEGMPNSLMEAMLCGCIPVGSDVAGIPTVMGARGMIVKHRDCEQVLEALDRAMESEDSPEEISLSVRERFSLENRLVGLKTALDSLA